jgi:aryl-alcohol dehydrogenase-like predicted oxidoreductase
MPNMSKSRDGRPLGNTGAIVSAVGLGTMALAIQNRPPEEEAVAVVIAGLDAGLTWIDTADSYCLDEREVGYGERLVARALREWGGGRNDIRVITKGGYVRPRGGWELDGRPDRLRTACEASLRALGVESIFLYLLHGPDPDVPFADSMGAIAELKRQGKVQHVGLSNVDAAQLREAREIAEIACVQNRCNPFDRHSFSNGLIEACERDRIAFIAHSPVGGHTGRGRVASDPTLSKVAARHGLTPQQIALAWLLASSPCMLAIPGATRVASVRASAGSIDVVLTPQDRAELGTAFPRLSSAARQLVAARREARHFVRTVRARVKSRAKRWLGR